MATRLDDFLPVGFLSVSFLLFAVMASAAPHVSDDATTGLLAYHSDVCIEVERTDGTRQIVDCQPNPNFFTPEGRNLVMHELGTGVSLGATNVIALCNISTGAVGAINCYGNNTPANGLGNATGTFAAIPNTFGNWSISNTFTATADNTVVNGTALLNGTAQGSGAIVFANNTFSAVTLNTNDQITIRWNISINSAS
jgi:hypothetical protein